MCQDLNGVMKMSNLSTILLKYGTNRPKCLVNHVLIGCGYVMPTGQGQVAVILREKHKLSKLNEMDIRMVIFLYYNHQVRLYL